jgi:hypothetical protein
MKGIVFTEFLEMIEHTNGYDLVDSLLLTSDLPSGGAYTAAGTYDHQEMMRLVGNLGQATHQSVAEILRQYGRYLFQTFVTTYTPFLAAAPDAFTFLRSVDNYIHVEVKKLYPDAELPTFTITQLNASTLQMVYQSSRKMADLAYGLIEGTLAHYGEVATITQQALNPDGSRVAFMITKVNELDSVV